ncbi:DUF2695 domain-containing protein [Arsenicicoccus dermatophilus]|uniref:DUF2695 domain-containing protein n=1 Tax=Arsenicicoccus dermatophilus TaxID=1076331 RepID=UPI0039173E09
MSGSTVEQDAVRELMGARPGECVVCYTGRMVERFGCDGSWRWVQTWRGQCAPRACRVEGRMAARGASCDCEIHLRGYEIEPRLLSVAWDGLVDGAPQCLGVRKGSTQPCRLWRPPVPGWWATTTHRGQA